jgi:pimeloyl-ACP methyl ester carboxylesterase
MPNALNAPTQFIDTATTRFAYRRFGDPSSPPLVCTQHFMGNLDNFDPLISDRLAERRELVLFDNAGVGRSTGTAATTIPGLAAAAITFVDALGLTRIDLLGHSMGGEVAQIIALERPDLVRRLVLVGTGPRGGDGMAQRDPAVATLFTKRDELGDAMWLPIMFAPTPTSQAAGRAWLQRISARQDDCDTPVSDATIAAWRSAASDWGQPANGFGYLNDIHQPTLVVNGDHDIVIATINSYHLYQNLPHAQLWLLPDANHGSHFQYPERFARRVIDFLDIEPAEDAASTNRHEIFQQQP